MEATGRSRAACAQRIVLSENQAIPVLEGILLFFVRLADGRRFVSAVLFFVVFLFVLVIRISAGIVLP
ncbi:hypothetical protein [Bradyrhizobium cenepequi]